MQGSIPFRVNIPLREPGFCVRVRVHVAPVRFLVRLVCPGWTQSDPGPECGGFGFVAVEMDLDWEVARWWTGVENGCCVRAGWTVGKVAGVAILRPLVC